MIGWGLFGVAFAGSLAEVEGTGVLGDCLGDPDCGTAVKESAADTLRAAAMSAQGLGLGLSPAMVRGTGAGIELSAQSLAVPTGAAPDGVDVFPGVPRLAIGGFGGGRIRYGGGLEGGAAVPTDGFDLGFSVGARGGFAIGSPDERRWIGFELDGGFALVEGVFFDEPRRTAVELSQSATIIVPECRTLPCVDVMNLVHAGIDTVLAYDVDRTAVLLLRLGGVFEMQTLRVALDGTRWSWQGFLPRATLGAAYRPNPRAWVAAAARLGVQEPAGIEGRARFPWLGALSIGWRFGPEALAASTRTPVVVEPPPPVVVIPKIAVSEHPELDCAPGIPTGVPPPLGLEGWCVTISEDGRVMQDGLYLRWHSPDQIAERGEFSRDRRSGTWMQYDPQGALLSHGNYVDGLKEGVWRTYYSNGQPHTEGTYEHGNETGRWSMWGEDGNTSVVGDYWNGQRTGIWRDYVGPTMTRTRVYRDGLMMTDESYLPE